MTVDATAEPLDPSGADEAIEPLFDEPAPTRRWSIGRITGGLPAYPLVVLFGLNAVDELDREAFYVLIPNIREHFDLSIQGVLLLSSLVALAVLLLEIPLSHLADRRNRVRISVVGASAWGGFSVLTGLATSVPMLGVARAGAGLGRAVNGSTHNSLLSDFYPATVRPGVFGFHRAANAFGMFAGPLLAGGIAWLLDWRAPFLLLSIPTFVFVVLALRLRDPARGGQERAALGADEETVATEEAPAGFSEAMRILWAVRSLRRTWMALPFVAVVVVGLRPLIQIFYEEEFGLDEVERGIASAISEPAQLIGFVVGIPIATRLMRRDPGLLVRFIAGCTAVSAGAIFLLVAAPNVQVAVAGQAVIAATAASVTPGLYSLFSLVVPARVRSLGFSVGNFFIIPALAAGPIVGGFADDWGLRPAILLLVPVLLGGALIINTAAGFVRADVDHAVRSTVAMAEVARERREGDPRILMVRDLDVSYGQTQVLFDVDFDVLDGEIVALLGTNGAGKSTLLKAISGLVAPERGVVVFDGRDITHADSAQGSRLGITQVPGEKGVFPALTVAEHFKLAAWTLRDQPEHVRRATEEVLGYFPVLRRRWDLPAGSLSGGEQQMLSLSQAFIAKPKLLLIDELSLGLAPTVVERLVRVLPAIHANGTAIVLVEQSVHTALRLAQRAVFMEKGEIRFSGPTADLLERHDLVRSMFLEGAASQGISGADRGDAAPGAADRRAGREPAAVVRSGSGADADAHPREPVLRVTDFSKHYGGIMAVDSVDLTLHDGEILGLIGPNGAGKTTIFDLISGFQALDRGEVVLHGVDVTGMPAHERARLGLGRSFQNARLWPSLTVREAVATALEAEVEVRAALPAFLHLPVVADSEAHVRARAEELLELLRLDHFGDKFISELSTGVRRMVDIAVQVASGPSVLLLDEPSSGIAQRETEALDPVLRDLQRHLGCSILIIEHDMPLITGLADRLVALDTGRVVTTGPPAEVLADPRVVESYLGAEWGAPV